MIGLARIAAPIACVGLAVLLTARTRQNRLAGLGYAAVGTALLVGSLQPPSAAETTKYCQLGLRLVIARIVPAHAS